MYINSEYNKIFTLKYVNESLLQTTDTTCNYGHDGLCYKMFKEMTHNSNKIRSTIDQF